MYLEKISPNENLRQLNFEAFKDRYGFIPQKDTHEDEKYFVTKAVNGSVVFYVKGALPGGLDLRLNSAYDPEYEAFVWAKRQEDTTRKTTIALCGFSSGVYLKALKRKMRPDTDFFIYEPEEGLFSFVCAYIDLRDIISDGHVRLYISEDQRKNMAQDMIWHMATYRPETIGIITPFYSSSEEFEGICDSMRIYGSTSRNYQKSRGRTAFKCRMYSWNHLWEGYSVVDLFGSLPKDIPAVIVGAGPSLTKNVEELRRLKGHALIISSDRALSTLDKYGIEPDLVSSVDAEKSPDYLKVKNLNLPYMLCSYQLNRDSQKLFEGRCIYYYGLDREQQLIGDKSDKGQGFDHGGHVVGSAFSLCRVMGIKTIILIGQDMAYLDGMHHADNIDDGVPDTEIREVEGISGDMVKTCDMWINFRNFYERQIALYPELRVIDATEGGALIHGSEVMKLCEVADKVCTKEYDLGGIFDHLSYIQTKDEYLLSIKVMESWMEELDQIKGNAKLLVDICLGLKKECQYGDIRDKKNENKLSRMSRLMTEIIGKSINYNLENNWVEDMYSIPDKNLMMRSNEEAKAVLESLINYYEKLQTDCMTLKEELKSAIETGKQDLERVLG